MSTGAQGTLLRLAVLVLVFAVLGLPVNDLYRYGLLALAALVAFTSTISVRPARWFCAAALALAVLLQHLFLGAPRIEEGHNVFLIDRPGGALERGLPPDVFRVMAERFNAAYPPAQRCDASKPPCWRSGVPGRAFAFAADGALDGPLHSGHPYSRRVGGIDFSSAVGLRLGVLNDLSLDFLGKEGDVERLRRDKRSLAIFGRWQNKLPYFLMYRFPPAFAGSEIVLARQRDVGGWRTVRPDRASRQDLPHSAERGCRQAHLCVCNRPRGRPCHDAERQREHQGATRARCRDNDRRRHRHSAAAGALASRARTAPAAADDAPHCSPSSSSTRPSSATTGRSMAATTD